MAEAQKEILESIRDIIGGADDDVIELTEVVKPANLFAEDLSKPAPNADTQDILSEIDSLLTEAPKQSITTPDAEIELADFAPKAIEPRPQAAEPVITQGDNKMSDEQLMTRESAASAEAALRNLANVANIASQPKIQSAPFRNGDTVEDMVGDMLKPLLKEWLNNNLPQLVQNIVEKEIKKLIPKE